MDNAELLDETYYAVDPDQKRKLDTLCAQLHGGNDRERDYGHRLWLVLNEIDEQRFKLGDLAALPEPVVNNG